jgi:cytochrome c peroxidase
MHRFKTPGLRNVELTWPYFHDGTRSTLEEAVRDMAYYQGDTKLSEQEINDIVAFLRTLTGEYQGKKLTSPHEYGITLGADHEHHHEVHHHE